MPDLNGWRRVPTSFPRMIIMMLLSGHIFVGLLAKIGG